VVKSRWSAIVALLLFLDLAAGDAEGGNSALTATIPTLRGKVLARASPTAGWRPAHESEPFRFGTSLQTLDSARAAKGRNGAVVNKVNKLGRIKKLVNVVNNGTVRSVRLWSATGQK
jgi:hypothetical protein